MTEKETSRMSAFRFIGSAESEFVRAFASRWPTAPAYKFDREFKGALLRLMQQYSREGGGGTELAKDNKLGAISGQLDDIKGIMHRNIDLVLERGEKIEILVNKTEQLGQRHCLLERTQVMQATDC